ncbi:penicillin-binding protein 2 [uncultured Rothia sp.]|uniref:peptidoglycan D,D-transpeptidase FtsI family protein n=1 Tax=uncultured Rothia sp. TaxID=316088 RepID=UPI0025D1DA17|nr:penicillin-binding protein 2 [uncultured Rothia sp.]
MSFDARHHANEPASGKPDLTRRGFLAGAAATGALGVIGVNLFVRQGFDPGGVANASRQKRLRSQVLPAVRGQILDINGNVMARSVQRYNLTADQTAVATFKRYNEDRTEKIEVTPSQLVYEMTDILKSVDPGITDEFIKSKLDGTSKYSVIKTDVSPEIFHKIDDLGAPFIYGEAFSQRLYPNGSVGGSVVGKYNIVDEPDGNGTGGTVTRNFSVGIERVFEKELAGTPGERTYEISADGVRIPVAKEEQRLAVDGKNVRLTINRDIQYFAQQVVRARAEELKAEWCTAIVMDVRDGSLLALADSSTMDPGAKTIEDATDMTPRAISQSVEPGSTEKMLTSSALIEQGLTTPTSVYDVPATLTIDGQTFKDAFEHPAQRRTFSGIITDSMNTGTVLVGQKLTKEERYNWLKKYGVGEFTGIELTGEQQGLISDWRDWDGRTQYTVLFGQGVAQTPLQTALIFQALGNKGVRLKPRIVDAIIDADGTEHKRPVEAGVRMVSEETASSCRVLMENMVDQGHARTAKVTGYRVGGKTGTAEAPSEKGGYDGNTTSFVGLAPIEDPRFLVAVTMQRPEGSVSTNGTTEEFSKIMEKTLHTYNVPRSTGEPETIPIFADGKSNG